MIKRKMKLELGEPLDHISKRDVEAFVFTFCVADPDSGLLYLQLEESKNPEDFVYPDSNGAFGVLIECVKRHMLAYVDGHLRIVKSIEEDWCEQISNLQKEMGGA